MDQIGSDLIERRRHQLEELIVDPRSTISIDTLLDTLNALIYDVEPVKKNKQFEKFFSKFSFTTRDIREKRPHPDDFQAIEILGRGAFGTVHLVRQKQTEKVFAMKSLSKFEMLKRSDSAFFWEERQIMAFAQSQWIVQLHYAFQDAKNLYLIMEYLPGGNLITLLDRNELSESAARFYCAEIILAIDAVHSLGYIHRDVKPDNMLIDINGHLKISDFGSCSKMDQNGFVQSDTAVGTPDYICPEVLQSPGRMAIYGREVDWWSVGVILYEMLHGTAPFYAESLAETYHNIINHHNQLHFPLDRPHSEDARDLISSFLNEKSRRLGRHGIDEIQIHPFFTQQTEWTWSTIREVRAPIIPTIIGDEDTRHFEVVDPNERPCDESFPISKTFEGNHLSFVGFSYSNEQQPFHNRRSSSLESERRFQRLQDDFNRKCQEQEVLNNKYSELERKHLVLVDEYQEIQQKLDSINRHSITKFERQIFDLSSQLQLEINANQDLRNARVQYERVNNELNDKYLNFMTKNVELDKEIVQLRDQLKEEMESKDIVDEKLRKLQDKYARLKDNLVAIEGRDAKHSDELAKLRRTIRHLEKENVDLNNELDRLEHKLHEEQVRQGNRANRNGNGHETTVKMLERQLSDQRYAQKKSHDEINQYKQKIERLESDVKETKDRYEKLQHDFDQQKKIFQQVSKEKNELEQEKQRLGTKFYRIEDQYQTVEVKSTDYEEKLKVSSQSSSQYRIQIDDLTEKLQHVEDERNYLQQELVDLTEEMKLINSRSKNDQDQIRTLEQEKRTMIDEAERLRKQFQSQLDSVESETNAIRERYEETQSELRQAIEARDEFFTKSEQLKEQLANLRQKFEAEHVNKLEVVKKLHDIMNTSPQPSPSFFWGTLPITFNNRREEHDRALRNALRTTQRELELIKLEYKECRTDRDEQLAMLTEEINRLKREKPIIHPPKIQRDSFNTWVDIQTRDTRRRGGWKRQYAVLNEEKFLLFNSDKDHQAALSIEFGQLYHVRSVTQGDIINSDTRMINRIFQMIYDIGRQTKQNDPDSPPATSDRRYSGRIIYKGHSFLPVTYRMTTICESCNQPCHGLISPPPCLLCTRCRVRCHRHHYDNDDQSIHTCRVYGASTVKELLILCTDEGQQKRWVDVLNTKIKRPRGSIRISSPSHPNKDESENSDF